MTRILEDNFRRIQLANLAPRTTINVLILDLDFVDYLYELAAKVVWSYLYLS